MCWERGKGTTVWWGGGGAGSRAIGTDEWRGTKLITETIRSNGTFLDRKYVVSNAGTKLMFSLWTSSL